MKKKTKRNLLSTLALICALAALGVSALALSSVPEDQTHLIDGLYQENQQLRTRVEELEAQLDQLMTAVNLQSWTLDANPWPDSTGADVVLTATPSAYQAGVTATFLVMLDGKEAASVPCHWDGTVFTATAALSAADGYSYFCLFSSPGGSQQLALTGPDAPDAGGPVYLQSSLSAYCNLVVNDWIENPGKLVLTDAYAQVQLPRICAAGDVEIRTAEIVLKHNGADSLRIPIKLFPSEVEGSLDQTITDLQISMPELETDDTLELYLEVVLTDGRRLSAFGVSWNMEDGKLTSAVG